VAGDTNDREDVFVHDRQTGKTTRVNLGPNGRQANSGSDSGAPAVSAVGRYVAFSSHASNLVRGDTNGTSDIFVRDRRLGKTARVSVGPENRQSNGESYYPSMSANGRFVAFTSRATNLVPGDTNGLDDVFIHDRQSGKTKRVTVGTDGAQGDDTSRTSSISDNGRYVAFQSRATNWSSNDINRCYDAYVHDRRTGVTSLAAGQQIDSCDSDDSESFFGYATHLGAISGNGRVVVFFSGAADLVPDDTNEVIDVFVHTR
jgi:Tol biopolymer transport system component